MYSIILYVLQLLKHYYFNYIYSNILYLLLIWTYIILIIVFRIHYSNYGYYFMIISIIYMTKYYYSYFILCQLFQFYQLFQLFELFLCFNVFNSNNCNNILWSQTQLQTGKWCQILILLPRNHSQTQQAAITAKILPIPGDVCTTISANDPPQKVQSTIFAPPQVEHRGATEPHTQPKHTGGSSVCENL